jgi:steroid 5-alpha reductase family enzyme
MHPGAHPQRTPVVDVLVPIAGLVVASLVMFVLWRRQLHTRNAGTVDVAWAALIGVLAVAYAAAGDAWAPRRVLVAVLAGIWSFRLAQHLFVRVAGEKEDGRYAAMRASLGERFDRTMLWFFQAQALLAWLLALPFLFLATASDPTLERWRSTDIVAVVLWIVSIAGESIADRQLAAWRSQPQNKGRTCRAGLWAYSRHPNYFFEWLHWCTYPVLAIGVAHGAWLWLAPLVLLVLVTKVTGIPPTEAQSLKSRGDDYRDYQRTTNAFFPGPRRRNQSGADRT